MGTKTVGSLGLWILSGLALASLPATAGAATIDLSTLLTNPSFESGVDAQGCPIGWTCTGSPTPGFGAYQPNTGPFPNQYTPNADGLPGGAVVPDGTHAAFSPNGGSSLAGSGGLSQVTSATWAPGNTYSFTFWVGLPNTSPIDGGPVVWPSDAVRVMITANGVTDGLCSGAACQMDIAPVAQGQWRQVVYNFTPTQDFGQNIGVAFFSSTGMNHQTVNFDIAQPSQTNQAPEPGSMLLVAAGLASLAFAKRRKTKA